MNEMGTPWGKCIYAGPFGAKTFLAAGNLQCKKLMDVDLRRRTVL